MPLINRARKNRLISLAASLIYLIISTYSTAYSAASNQGAMPLSNEVQKPLLHLAQTERDDQRIFKKSSPPVNSAQEEEDIFSNPGNIVLAGLAAVAIGSAAYISSVYEEEKIPSLNVTAPLENEEVFWITAVQGTSLNYKEGDHVVIDIQKHGEEEWIEQEGYGEIDLRGGNWVVRFCQFGVPGPDDVGNSFRFRATMKDYKDNFLYQQLIENVVRK